MLLQVRVLLPDVFSQVGAKPGIMAIAVACLRVHLGATLAAAESAIPHGPLTPELPFITCGGGADPQRRGELLELDPAPVGGPAGVVGVDLRERRPQLVWSARGGHWLAGAAKRSSGT